MSIEAELGKLADAFVHIGDGLHALSESNKAMAKAIVDSHAVPVADGPEEAKSDTDTKARTKAALEKKMKAKAEADAKKKAEAEAAAKKKAEAEAAAKKKELEEGLDDDPGEGEGEGLDDDPTEDMPPEEFYETVLKPAFTRLIAPSSGGKSNVAALKKIFSDFSAEKGTDLKEEDYPAVLAKVEKAIKERK